MNRLTFGLDKYADDFTRETAPMKSRGGPDYNYFSLPVLTIRALAGGFPLGQAPKG